MQVKCPNGDIVVLSVRSSSPAEEARLVQGDRIVAVEGKELRELGLDCQQAAALVSGADGTYVNLRVLGAEGNLFDARVLRRPAPPPSRDMLVLPACVVCVCLSAVCLCEGVYGVRLKACFNAHSLGHTHCTVTAGVC